MEQFNLEKYLANPSLNVVTRDGRKVRIICTDMKSTTYPVVALIENGSGYEQLTTFPKNGEYAVNESSRSDLFFASEKGEGWFNIYHCDNLGFYIRQNQPYKSKKEADEIAKANFRTFFATVKVEWEE